MNFSVLLVVTILVSRLDVNYKHPFIKQNIMEFLPDEPYMYFYLYFSNIIQVLKSKAIS